MKNDSDCFDGIESSDHIFIKPEIQRLFDRADRFHEKGLITEKQYQEHLAIKAEIKKVND